MLPINQKQREREVLALVYDETEYAEILCSECPDFWIRHTDSNDYFGVEITEFYFSESNARIRNIPAYFNEIIEERWYRHREDKEALKVSEFSVFSPDGKPKGNIHGILQKLPQPEEYANMIMDSIASKDAKFVQYDQELTHINLIILDTEGGLRSIPIDNLYRYFFTAPMRTALYTSRFRELFLVTMLEESRRVYIPLKMLLLLADFFMFRTIVLEYQWETAKDCSIESSEKDASLNLMMLFTKYMKSKTNQVRFRRKSEQVEVLFGNSSLFLDGGNVGIYDHNDHPLPVDAQEMRDDQLTAFFSSAEFCEREREILKMFTFFSNIAYDVKGDLEF